MRDPDLPVCSAPTAPWSARPMTEADIAAVLAMEAGACADPSHAWSEQNYRSSLQSHHWARVCEPLSNGRGHVLGVCVAMRGVDEMHLLNLAVARPLHGLGIARALLARLIACCAQEGVSALWLEVRLSNTRARALYERQGFAAVSVRKRYYPALDGREDALVMRLALNDAHGALNALV